MKVINVHRRLLCAPASQVGDLLDALGSPTDGLWPRRLWPAMKLDRPLAVGANGGHGPIRYTVEAYQPGALVQFRFTGPKGFDGWHRCEVLDATPTHCVLEHRIDMRTRGLAQWSWALLYRPMHDALIEDALSQAQTALGIEPQAVPWSPFVRLVRRLSMGRRRVYPSTHPESSHVR